MRQVTHKGLMTVAAATGVLAAAGGYAHADSGAIGASSNSPGVVSGNTVQAPVHVPVNVCGNTLNVVGILNPAMGNACANQGGGSDSSAAGSSAEGQADDSPGVASGNHIQAPVDVPVNACGNSVSVIGVENSASDNGCGNASGSDDSSGTVTPPDDGRTTPPATPDQPATPGQPATPDQPGDRTTPGHTDSPSTSSSSDDTRTSSDTGLAAQTGAEPQGSAQLAHTGSDLPLGLVLSAGAGTLLAGAVLYRKARAAA
jgi:hypothetical protein